MYPFFFEQKQCSALPRADLFVVILSGRAVDFSEYHFQWSVMSLAAVKVFCFEPEMVQQAAQEEEIDAHQPNPPPSRSAISW
jgi:hypothetical protein